MKPSENKRMDRTMDSIAIVGNAVMAAIAWAMSYSGLPIEPALILTVLMLADFITGVGRAYCIGEEITSRKIRYGIISKLCLLLVPFVLAVAAKGIAPSLEFNGFVEMAVSLFILAEAYSVISNVYAIKTGQSLPEFDVIALLGKKLRDMLNKMLDSDK